MPKSEEPLPSRRDRAMALVFHLKSIPLFSGLGADALLPVAAITEQESFKAGEVIFEQGDAGEHLYVITRGQVEVVRGEERLASLGVGECFGEMAVLDRTKRSATVRTLEDTELLTTGREHFHDLLDLYPELARGIARVLTERLRKATQPDEPEGEN